MHRNKRTHLFLKTEGLLRHIEGIELIECNETLELDHRGCLIDGDMWNYFSEELLESDVKLKRMLNQNRTSYRNVFAEKHNTMLNVINV